ncbi:acyl-CoA/acyl-ACP dehydrogenase [Agreia sp. VKM Ac-1783]|uniref:acyl-CoA/acyl-ACP dehydrogenase n=1 Tax=Agreia sp. VKM Ac-1783 TaxID=1938889 RepID=UPI000A2AA683|nr:acyl-CoA/acyl-ACP dehydrogenase [Agreia sp. VKM Ac-1783]SMQ71954.1 Acyl-CoA dehydrogenase [Agreia sp. VKM Ac-1783]
MPVAESLESWAARAAEVAGDPQRAIDLALAIGTVAPTPASGETPALFELFRALGRADLTAARVVEAHLDARAILAEAGHEPQAGTWGVFAAEGPGVRLDAHDSNGAFRLSGTKPWCSMAQLLDRALVTAHTAGGHRRLFEVELRAEGVGVRSGEWIALGLQGVPSGAVDFDDVVSSPVGADDWYLDRPGFAWGGIGVAACWLGGAEGLAHRLLSSATSTTREPDQIALMHLGAVDAGLFAARVALDDAGRRIDDGRAEGNEGRLLAARVRIVVATVVEDVLRRVAHSLGPAPLALEAEHARRVADLELYVRQHHAERDEASLGRRIVAEEPKR